MEGYAMNKVCELKQYTENYSNFMDFMVIKNHTMDLSLTLISHYGDRLRKGK